jgi:uncharacterized protein involved in exopolysaccharide biosynthesis
MMPDIFDLIRNWWKQILLITALSMIAAGVLSFLKPRQYLSVSTAVPSSAFLSDKASVFNENIQALYTTLGTPDDLDLVVGTSRLDTVYLRVTDQFNLFDHYKVKGEEARSRSAVLLKKNTRITKSDYGELKVRVWDTDKNLAPQLANALMKTLQEIHTNLKNATNQSILAGLKKALQTDSLALSQRDRYEKLIDEYQLMMNTKTPALLIVENAKAALHPDRPRIFRNLFATAVLSLLFGMLVSLVLERRKMARS